MSKVKNFSRWFKHFSSLGDAALEDAMVGVFDRAERAEVYKELDQNPEIDLHDMVCCITYANHCTAPLLARITELEAAQTWQPIESAPKDGTWILVIDNTFDGLEGAFVAQRARCFGGCWLTNSFGKRDVVRATHWMPLPTPPKGEAS